MKRNPVNFATNIMLKLLVMFFSNAHVCIRNVPKFFQSWRRICHGRWLVSFNTHEHNVHTVTSLILSGLRGRFVPEWSDIYAAIATYIDEMFSESNKLIDNKNEQVHGQIHDWLLSD